MWNGWDEYSTFVDFRRPDREYIPHHAGVEHPHGLHNGGEGEHSHGGGLSHGKSGHPSGHGGPSGPGGLGGAVGNVAAHQATEHGHHIEHVIRGRAAEHGVSPHSKSLHQSGTPVSDNVSVDGKNAILGALGSMRSRDDTVWSASYHYKNAQASGFSTYDHQHSESTSSNYYAQMYSEQTYSDYPPLLEGIMGRSSSNRESYPTPGKEYGKASPAVAAASEQEYASGSQECAAASSHANQEYVGGSSYHSSTAHQESSNSSDSRRKNAPVGPKAVAPKASFPLYKHAEGIAAPRAAGIPPPHYNHTGIPSGVPRGAGVPTIVYEYGPGTSYGDGSGVRESVYIESPMWESAAYRIPPPPGIEAKATMIETVPTPPPGQNPVPPHGHAGKKHFNETLLSDLEHWANTQHHVVQQQHIAAQQQHIVAQQHAAQMGFSGTTYHDPHFNNPYDELILQSFFDYAAVKTKRKAAMPKKMPVSTKKAGEKAGGNATSTNGNGKSAKNSKNNSAKAKSGSGDTKTTSDTSSASKQSTGTNDANTLQSVIGVEPDQAAKEKVPCSSPRGNAFSAITRVNSRGSSTSDEMQIESGLFGSLPQGRASGTSNTSSNSKSNETMSNCKSNKSGNKAGQKKSAVGNIDQKFAALQKEVEQLRAENNHLRNEQQADQNFGGLLQRFSQPADSKKSSSNSLLSKTQSHSQSQVGLLAQPKQEQETANLKRRVEELTQYIKNQGRELALATVAQTKESKEGKKGSAAYHKLEELHAEANRKLKAAEGRITDLQAYIKSYSSSGVFFSYEELQIKMEEHDTLKRMVLQLSADLQDTKTKLESAEQSSSAEKAFWENTCKRLIGIISKFLMKSEQREAMFLEESSRENIHGTVVQRTASNKSTISNKLSEKKTETSRTNSKEAVVGGRFPEYAVLESANVSQMVSAGPMEFVRVLADDISNILRNVVDTTHRIDKDGNPVPGTAGKNTNLGSLRSTSLHSASEKGDSLSHSRMGSFSNKSPPPPQVTLNLAERHLINQQMLAGFRKLKKRIVRASREMQTLLGNVGNDAHELSESQQQNVSSPSGYKVGSEPSSALLGLPSASSGSMGGSGSIGEVQSGANLRADNVNMLSSAVTLTELHADDRGLSKDTHLSQNTQDSMGTQDSSDLERMALLLPIKRASGEAGEDKGLVGEKSSPSRSVPTAQFSALSELYEQVFELVNMLFVTSQKDVERIQDVEGYLNAAKMNEQRAMFHISILQKRIAALTNRGLTTVKRLSAADIFTSSGTSSSGCGNKENILPQELEDANANDPRNGHDLKLDLRYGGGHEIRVVRKSLTAAGRKTQSDPNLRAPSIRLAQIPEVALATLDNYHDSNDGGALSSSESARSDRNREPISIDQAPLSEGTSSESESQQQPSATSAGDNATESAAKDDAGTSGTKGNIVTSVAKGDRQGGIGTAKEDISILPKKDSPSKVISSRKGGSPTKASTDAFRKSISRGVFDTIHDSRPDAENLSSSVFNIPESLEQRRSETLNQAHSPLIPLENPEFGSVRPLSPAFNMPHHASQPHLQNFPVQQQQSSEQSSSQQNSEQHLSAKQDAEQDGKTSKRVQQAVDKAHKEDFLNPFAVKSKKKENKGNGMTTKQILEEKEMMIDNLESHLVHLELKNFMERQQFEQKLHAVQFQQIFSIIPNNQPRGHPGGGGYPVAGHPLGCNGAEGCYPAGGDADSSGYHRLPSRGAASGAGDRGSSASAHDGYDSNTSPSNMSNTTTIVNDLLNRQQILHKSSQILQQSGQIVIGANMQTTMSNMTNMQTTMSNMQTMMVHQGGQIQQQPNQLGMNQQMQAMNHPKQMQGQLQGMNQQMADGISLQMLAQTQGHHQSRKKKQGNQKCNQQVNQQKNASRNGKKAKNGNFQSGNSQKSGGQAGTSGMNNNGMNAIEASMCDEDTYFSANQASGNLDVQGSDPHNSINPSGQGCSQGSGYHGSTQGGLQSGRNSNQASGNQSGMNTSGINTGKKSGINSAQSGVMQVGMAQVGMNENDHINDNDGIVVKKNRRRKRKIKTQNMEGQGQGNQGQGNRYQGNQAQRNQSQGSQGDQNKGNQRNLDSSPPKAKVKYDLFNPK